MIRDVATGRFIDRDKLHYVDFDGRSSASRARRSCPARRRASRVVAAARPLGGAVRVRRAVRRRRVRHAGRRATTSPAGSADVRAAEATRRPRRAAAADVRRPRRASSTTRAGCGGSQRLQRLDELDGRPLRSDAAIFTGTPTELADLLRGLARRTARRVPPAPRRARPSTSSRSSTASCPSCSGAARSAPRTTGGRCAPASASPARPAATPPRRCRRERRVHDRASRSSSRAYFPGVNNTTVWSDPAVRQPDRVRVVRPPRPDRRAGQVRLLLPRRGAAPARAARQDPRPRRRRPARHADGAGRARRR